VHQFCSCNTRFDCIRNLEKRAWTLQQVPTQAGTGAVQGITKAIGPVTFQILVSVDNIVSIFIENGGAEAAVYQVVDQRNGWNQHGVLISSQSVVIPEVSGEGGDTFSIGVNE
jgi:hypothetical protein